MSACNTLRKYIAEHPGLTSTQLADALGMKRNDVSSNVNFMSIRAVTPTLERREVARTITNQPVYGYWPVTSTSVQIKDSHVEKRATKKSTSSPLDSLVDQLAAQLAKQLAVKVKDRLAVELESMMPSPVIGETDLQPLLDRLALPAPVKETKVTKPRVGVVGLLPVQAGELTAEFGDVLDLRFASDNADELKSLKNCDVVFLHTRHMKHSHDQYVRTFGVKVIRCTGGVSKLRDELTAYYANL